MFNVLRFTLGLRYPRAVSVATVPSYSLFLIWWLQLLYAIGSYYYYYNHEPALVTCVSCGIAPLVAYTVRPLAAIGESSA